MPLATAQEETSSTDKEIEQLYDKFDRDQSAKQKKEVVERKGKQKAKPDAVKLTDLGTLAPFEDIAVIERKFLPKTGRFEVTGLGLTGLNNPFFNNLGLAVQLAYFFREKYGVEAMYYYVSSTQRDATKNLFGNRQVITNSLVTPKGYLGAAFKWNPVYGKVAFLNHRIIPFDLNFSLGGGTTQTDSGSSPTIHVGTSQNFAISKRLALRWDLAWNFYQTKSTVVNAPSQGTQIDLFLGLGVSFFFPEATYR